MKLTSSYYTGEGPSACPSGIRPSPSEAVHPGFGAKQWPWDRDSDISRSSCNDFDLQPAPKPRTPSIECGEDLDIFLDYEFDRRVARAAAIGVGVRTASHDGGFDMHATRRRAHLEANHNGSWQFPRRLTSECLALLCRDSDKYAYCAAAGDACVNGLISQVEQSFLFPMTLAVCMAWLT